MEELPQLLLKALLNLEYLQLELWNKPLYLQFVDQKLGILKLSVLLGGYIMTRFQNLRQLVSFCQQVHLWLEVSVTLSILIEWRWEWLFFIGWTMNRWFDISSIKRILGRKLKPMKSLNYKGLHPNRLKMNNMLLSTLMHKLVWQNKRKSKEQQKVRKIKIKIQNFHKFKRRKVLPSRQLLIPPKKKSIIKMSKRRTRARNQLKHKLRKMIRKMTKNSLNKKINKNIKTVIKRNWRSCKNILMSKMKIKGKLLWKCLGLNKWNIWNRRSNRSRNR